MYIFGLLCMSNCELAIDNRPTLTFDIILALTGHASNDGLWKADVPGMRCRGKYSTQLHLVDQLYLMNGAYYEVRKPYKCYRPLPSVV